jgi:hypothetical protein
MGVFFGSPRRKGLGSKTLKSNLRVCCEGECVLLCGGLSNDTMEKEKHKDNNRNKVIRRRRGLSISLQQYICYT